MISEKAKRSGLRKKILGLIPVYGHYKLEEELREWDRSVRDEAVFYLSKGEALLVNMLETAVTTRDRNVITRIEKSRKNLHTVKEKIKTQTYGYFPRFSPIKIDKKVLGSVLDLDEEIVSKSQNIKEKLQALLNKFEGGAEKEAILDLQDVEGSLQPIDSLLSKRFETLRTAVLEEEKHE